MTSTVVSFRTARRWLVVSWIVFPLAWSLLRDRRRWLIVGSPRQPDPEQHRQRAERLVETFLELGPTFIKLGQLLSTRPDVLPKVYIDELSRLQDDVPPTDWEATRAVLEAELGPIEERFETFDTDAISGASLGQVYRATLDGEPVAVKVRRPGVTSRVEEDLRVIRWWVRLVLPFVDEARSFSLQNLAGEFATVIREEMDYDRERAMLVEIGANFEDRPGVVIPAPIESHSTDRVLTMEYHEGTKITDIEALDRQGIDRTALAERLERAYLLMIIEDGVFQADPHPGNLAVKPDGTLVFYDFGMSGRVEADVQGRIVDFYVAVGERDFQGIIDALIALGTLRPDVDRQVMREVLELGIRDARGERIEEYRVRQLIGRIESTLYEFPLRLPSRLALVMRVATVVEGVCVTLDPSFDFIEVASAFLHEQGYREAAVGRSVADTGRSAAIAGRSVLRAAPTAERVLDRLDRDDAFVRVGLEDPLDVLEQLGRRIGFAILAGASLVASAVIYVEVGLDPALAVTLVLTIIAGGLAVRRGRSRGISAQPSFTRHQLRQRRGGE